MPRAGDRGSGDCTRLDLKSVSLTLPLNPTLGIYLRHARSLPVYFMPCAQKAFLCGARGAPLSPAVHFGCGHTVRGVVVWHILSRCPASSTVLLRRRRLRLNYK